MISRRDLPLLLLGGTIVAARPAWADDDEDKRAARWKEVREAVFGDRAVGDGSGVIGLEAPPRAEDAALVPVALLVNDPARVSGVYLVIDGNPGPLAAHVHFGALADPRRLTLRVRVDQYTDMHAVAETRNGELLAVSRFVKAAGGCSTPMGSQLDASLSDAGFMRLRLIGPVVPGHPIQALLMVRHPNFNGMQMDPVSRNYTPARFIQTVDIGFEGQPVLRMDSDISLASDPAIGFGFTPPKAGKLTVAVRDSSGAAWHEAFDVAPLS